jgi:predicted aconitase with swiveling domain
VLLEAVRAGTAPAAIVLGEPDSILTLGALVAVEMYGARLPVIVIADAVEELREGCWVTLSEAGELAVADAPHGEEE